MKFLNVSFVRNFFLPEWRVSNVADPAKIIC